MFCCGRISAETPTEIAPRVEPARDTVALASAPSKAVAPPPAAKPTQADAAGAPPAQPRAEAAVEHEAKADVAPPPAVAAAAFDASPPPLGAPPVVASLPVTYPTVAVHRAALDVFTRLDLNDDNELKLSELAEVHASVSEAEALFAQLDLDGDGTVTRSEFAEAIGRLERAQGTDAAVATVRGLSAKVGDYLTSSEGVAARLFSKGFCLGQLLDFVDEYCHKRGMVGETTTTNDVVRDIVVPQTRERVCCFADLLPGGAKTPETLMSHWWGNTFLSLVKAICEHAAGKSELYAHMYTAEEKAKTYWLCIFAVNQHQAACEYIAKCDCGTPKFGSGDPRCQVDKFPAVLRRMRKHALAMDAQLITLERVWVLSELDSAMRAQPVLKTQFCGAVAPDMLEKPRIPAVKDAQASFEADKTLIIGEIAAAEGGLERFDQMVRAMALREIALLHCFTLVPIGNIATIGRELDARPELIDSPNTKGRGETLLMLAARFGHLALVRDLLARRGDVAKSTAMGWTALHYAAICFNPRSQDAIVSALIQAGAPTAATNSFGRTALEECVLCAGPNAVSTAFLVDATPGGAALFENARQKAEGNGMFHPEADDAALFAHQVLRQDSWERPDLWLAIKQPNERGEIEVFNSWVKPIEFGTQAGELVPPYDQMKSIVHASRRFAGYIRYRWPLWTFDKVVLKFTTDADPANYRIDLTPGELRQVNRQENVVNALREKNDVLTKVQGSIRMLYP